ncbi:glycosyltransferase family 2 protein [Petrimonas sulfuriphila]|jgi:glycosyltransferase involved in cell wall biosynthesis|uniref:glycosyltransferase family 2 protein n=1 Tax=Petrimonas sulfuriphila TaxID=285070 RepID=UPI003EBB151C
MQPLLAIIIATRNRQKYALSAVESILSINDDSIEVVVQDNSDNDSLREMLNPFMKDVRLIYNYTEKPLSFVANFDLSIHLSRAEYVCQIGDDDGINPEIIHATKWAKKNNVDALVGNTKANYRWEGAEAPDTLFTKLTGSTLTIENFSGKLEKCNVQEALEKFSRNGCTNYSQFKLPKLYHGIVKRECLDNIKNMTDSYFKGLSPDIYASITLACVVKNLIYIDYPLTIPGICSVSGTLIEGQIKKHSKEIQNAPHLKNRGYYEWSREVPPVYCVPTIWADSAFAALREMKRNDLIKLFNEYMLYANIISDDKSLKKSVITFMKEQRKITEKSDFIRDALFLSISYIKGPIYNFITQRAFKRLLFILRIKDITIKRELIDINAAMLYLKEYLDSRKMHIEKYIN